MNDNQKAFEERCQKALRLFFPEDYADSRFEVPTEVSAPYAASFLYAEIIGLSLRFARDRKNSVADRIAALEVARKAGLDQIGILDLEARAKADDE